MGLSSMAEIITEALLEIYYHGAFIDCFNHCTSQNSRVAIC